MSSRSKMFEEGKSRSTDCSGKESQCSPVTTAVVLDGEKRLHSPDLNRVFASAIRMHYHRRSGKLCLYSLLDIAYIDLRGSWQWHLLLEYKILHDKSPGSKRNYTPRSTELSFPDDLNQVGFFAFKNQRGI